MSALRLIRLVFLGKEVSPATVTFGPALTVIYGASDAGKSYIVDAIDFMLGGKRLKSIPEAELFSTVMLGVELPDESRITLVRRMSGGQFSVYLSDLTDFPKGPADFVLAPANNQASAKRQSVSRFFLEQLGMGGRKLRKNRMNVTVPLSFRNLCALCIIDETKMQSPVPPPLSGQHVTATAEVSTFKLLLQGEDDSAVAQEADALERRKIGKGQIEVLERLLRDLENSMEESDTPIGLSGQLARLVRSVEEQAAAINSVLESRNDLLREHAAVAHQGDVLETRLREVNELTARFELLREKYDSDLERLEMVREAGGLLGFFKPGVCVFCGAEVEHQNAGAHMAEEVTAFGESVSAEIQKTIALRGDLVSTIADLGDQRSLLETEIRDFYGRMNGFRSSIEALDNELRPRQSEINSLLTKRSEIERKLAAFAQIERIETLRLSLQPGPAEETPVAPGLNDRALREFSETVKVVLSEWGVPVGDSIRFGKSENDLLVDDQPRASRGKGMRAILHAAFTSALAQYCFSRDLEHPGFIVLDSPLVTYREPDPGSADQPTEEEFETVASSFYRYLDGQFLGQSIIVENTDPPENLSEDAVLVHFTKRPGSGRYGLFPALTAR
ncbi:AAA family ATPase [Dactylosporangium sucinum]|uniref:Rad50/SbcC-type AAA domain-containing protein n=1 Tax=Dactylosporangium sucinum TaxID=1424081 RepID=A0A917T513_9ACTN|nr:AAA family ATPase [Dactylosporangium sucinum]GGM11399.1 hypothetical protein GCM10007977_010690 [Dactylosporangium sucinum]